MLDVRQSGIKRKIWGVRVGYSLGKLFLEFTEFFAVYISAPPLLVHGTRGFLLAGLGEFLLPPDFRNDGLVFSHNKPLE